MNHQLVFKKLDYDEAVRYARNSERRVVVNGKLTVQLGRLPTITELNELLNSGSDPLKDCSFWSSTDYDVDGYKIIWSFSGDRPSNPHTKKDSELAFFIIFDEN